MRDLLDLEIDVAAYLPPDTISHGFDNIADVQTLSPTLMEGYLRAASRISTAAVGDRDAAASEATFKVPRTASQMRHIEGAPVGTRGGVSVLHNFAADGQYVFRMMLHGEPTGRLFGTTDADGEQLEVSIDGERVALLAVDPFLSESDSTGLNMQTEPIAVRAGSHRVSAAFIERFAGVVDDLIAPIEHTLADTQIGTAYGITLLPHLRDLGIVGPYRVTGVSETSSRRAIFSCRPTSRDDEMTCATENRDPAGRPGVSPAAGRGRPRRSDAVLRRRPRRGRFRGRRAHRATGHSRESPFCVPCRAGAGRCRPG